LDWQQALTAIAVVTAGVIVLRAAVQTLSAKGRGGCASGCGKCAVPEPSAQPGRIRLPQI
jgi:hypothetical protein